MSPAPSFPAALVTLATLVAFVTPAALATPVTLPAPVTLVASFAVPVAFIALVTPAALLGHGGANEKCETEGGEECNKALKFHGKSPEVSSNQKFY